jgi:hypothetical protein
MGSGASKTASSTSKIAVKATPRKYPTRAPIPSAQNNALPTKPLAEERLGPSVHPSTNKSAVAETRDKGILCFILSEISR